MATRKKMPRYNVSESIALLLAVLIPFTDPLMTAIPIFTYLDEAIIIICLAAYIISITVHHKKLTRTERRIILFFSCFVAIGLLSNSTSKVEINSSAKTMDIIGFAKFFVVSLGGFSLFKRRNVVNHTFSIVLTIVKILVLSGLAFAILNQFVDLGMRDDYRYGIYCFKFIYDSAGVFSWYCYMFLIVLSIDLLRGGNQTKKRIYIVLDMIMWIFTGRSRGLAFIAIYIALIILFRIIEMRKKQVKIRFSYLIVLGVLAIFVAWDQIVFYFTTSNQARNLLLFGGIRLFRQYFPFGAGFGTFGTSAAQKYYSPLYNYLGYNSIYGLSSTNSLYLTDTFWPAVLGETGLFGFVFYALMLFYVFKHLHTKITSNDTTKFLMIFVIVSMIASSVATAVFSQNATVGDILFLCMIPAIIGRKRTYG